MSAPSSAVALAAERAREAADDTPPWRPRVRTLGDLLADPAVTAPADYIVPPLAESGETALLAAPPKKGKSTLVSQLAAELSTGGVALDGSSLTAGPVLWLGFDEPTRRLAPRLEELGAHPGHFHIIEREPGQVLRAAHLAAVLDEYRPRLVVLDTTSQLATDAGVDPNDGQAVAAFMRPMVDAIRAAAAVSPCAAVFVHHAPWHASRAAGSVQWSAVVDTVAVLRSRRRGVDLRADEPDDEGEGDDGERILEGIGRAAGPFKMRLNFTGGRYVLTEAPPPLIDRVRSLLATVDCGPGVSSANRLREALRCQSAALHDTLAELEQRGEIRAVGAARSPHRHYVPTASARLYAPASAEPTPSRASSRGVQDEAAGKKLAPGASSVPQMAVDGGKMTAEVAEEAAPPAQTTSSRLHGYTHARGKKLDGAPAELPLDEPPAEPAPEHQVVYL